MLIGTLIVGISAVTFGLLLGVAATRLRVQRDSVVSRIDALLPQTQCGQCSYAGCRPYAAAIAAGEADINQCPPGGEATIWALASLLNREPIPLNQQYGSHKDKRVAIIDEQICIGCTLCIQACPVDAILGATKQMHTVIQIQCTGCELCLPPCPVDCISMVAAKEDIGTWKWPFPYSHELNETPSGSLN